MFLDNLYHTGLFVFALFGVAAWSFCAGAPKIIYLIPPYGFEEKNLFLNADNCPWSDFQYAIKKVKDALKKQGYQLLLRSPQANLHDGSMIVYFDLWHKPFTYWKINHDAYEHDLLQSLAPYKKHKLILFLLEPDVVVPVNYDTSYHNYFKKVYTVYDDLVDNEKYFKFFYPYPYLQMITSILDFDEKNLCTLVASNKYFKHPNELYTERKKIIKFFENLKTKDFEFYGGIAGNNSWDKKRYKTYKGTVPSYVNKEFCTFLPQSKQDKINCLSRYKFCICYENTKNSNGYITEKIFDCFAAGCVPVYWGAKNIHEYIPSECYICRENFESDEQLYAYLKGITKSVYQDYIDAIKDYLQTEHAKLFSVENFVNIFLEAVLSNNYTQGISNE